MVFSNWTFILSLIFTFVVFETECCYTLFNNKEKRSELEFTQMRKDAFSDYKRLVSDYLEIIPPGHLKDPMDVKSVAHLPDILDDVKFMCLVVFKKKVTEASKKAAPSMKELQVIAYKSLVETYNLYFILLEGRAGKKVFIDQLHDIRASDPTKFLSFMNEPKVINNQNLKTEINKEKANEQSRTGYILNDEEVEIRAFLNTYHRRQNPDRARWSRPGFGSVPSVGYFGD